MTNYEFHKSLAGCCSGDRRTCGIRVGDRVTWDGGADPYSVRAYTGTVVGINPGRVRTVTIRHDGWNTNSEVNALRVGHLRCDKCDELVNVKNPHCDCCGIHHSKDLTCEEVWEFMQADAKMGDPNP